jgi:hypothetical protein
MFTQNEDFYSEPVIVDFEAGVEVLPLGLKHEEGIATSIFKQWNKLNPENVPKDLLEEISTLYWQKKQFAPSAY